MAVKDLARALSHGYFGIVESKKLIDLAYLAAEGGEVRSLDGEPLQFDPENTIRIAVLHHHPVVTIKAEEEMSNDRHGRWRRFIQDPFGELNLVKKDIESSLMKMDGADEFLSSCLQVGIQLVLFGHQHFPYQRMIVPEGGGAVKSPFGVVKSMRAFCCPSTLEYKASSNGFYIFDFFDKSKVSMESYVSMRDGNRNSSPFTPDARSSFSFDLNQSEPLSKEDVKAAYKVNVPEASLAKIPGD